MRTIWWELAPKLMIASRLPKTSTLLSSEAYRLYSKGRYAWNKRTKAGLMAGSRILWKVTPDRSFLSNWIRGSGRQLYRFGNFRQLGAASVVSKGNCRSVKSPSADPDLGEARVSLATAQAFFELTGKSRARDFAKRCAETQNTRRVINGTDVTYLSGTYG